MPLYEYECKKCHKRLEKIQHFDAPPEKICPHCGGALKRVISAPAFKFKGSGWYITDYAKSSNGFEAAPDGHGESNGKEGKTESSNGDTSGATNSATPAASSSSDAPVATSPSTSESSSPAVSTASTGTSNP